MAELSSKEKAALRSAAQRIKASVRIGKNGITSEVLAELEEAFRKANLVKVAFNADRKTIVRLANELEKASGAACVGGVGKKRSYYKAFAESTDAQ